MVEARGDKATTATMRKRLLRRMGRTIEKFSLIGEGDRILVAISGGKDSYTLLDLLVGLQSAAPISFELVAVHVDQGQPGYDGRPLEEWLAGFGCEFEIVRRDTYSKVVEVTPPGKAYCAPCSRMRRGILYSTAERLGCNKIALGHHREDAVETFLMNAFYSGKLHTLPPHYETEDGRFEVIRPLIECPEDDIVANSNEVGYPILPCNLCGSQDGLRRQRVKSLLAELEQEHPDIRGNLLAALGNVDPSRLLDPRYQE